MRASLLVDCRNAHGEGVVWSSEHRLLGWTDIHGDAIWTLDPTTQRTDRYPVPGRICCFAFRKGRPPQEILAAFDDGISLINLAAPERRATVRPAGLERGQRLNDGRTDRCGRLIVGGMDEENLLPVSAVWRVDPDLTVETLFNGVACANGLCFSPGGETMYFADSPTRRIEAFAYDAEAGIPSARRTIGRVAGEGVPDGSCIDAEGFIWNAVWEGYRVERWSPDGQLDRIVEVPVRKPTCCTFGGAALETLFITTSRLAESEADLAHESTAGGLFAVRPGPRGIPDAPFAA
jgi:L-arabinonolactonase